MHYAYMSKEAAITVRVPLEVKSRLNQRAVRERRSISAQVLFELERAVQDEQKEAENTKPALGLFKGASLPSDDDLREVRAVLWGRIGTTDV